MLFLIPILTAVLPTLIPALINKVVPKLVQDAEVKLADHSGEQKKEWVMAFFDDLEEVLAARDLITPKVRAVWNAMQPTISEAIERAVERMKAKKAV